MRGIISNQEGKFQALQVSTNNKGKRKGIHQDKKEIHKSYKKRDWSKVQCFKCDKFGHIHNFCPEREKIQAALAEVMYEKDENHAFYIVKQR